MGFGAGLWSPPRAGRVLGDGERAGWSAQPLTLPLRFQRILVLTPPGTPPGYDRDMLAALGQLDDHARRLVTQAAPDSDRVTTERTVLGDARDLLVHALRRALADNLLDVDLGHRATAAELDDPRLLCVHVGATDFARQLLRDVRRGRGGWDGAPETLDADGFAYLCAHRGSGALHLLAVGGSDYGTFFGIAALLEEALDAAWVHPGEAGEVIPARGSVATADVLDRFEEPAVRSRAFALMSTAQLTPAEIDAMRTWQLCNRLRPVTDRSTLYAQSLRGRTGLPRENFGRPPGSEAFHYAMLESEARFPADHAMRNLLSPFLPPVTPEVGLPLESAFGDRYLVQPSTWPELRPRAALTTERASFDAAPTGMVSPFVGTIEREPPYTWTPIRCAGSEAECPEFQPYDQARGRRDNTARQARRMSDPSVQDGGPVKVMCGYRALPTSGASAGSIWRFFPLTWRDRIDGPQFPLNDWHPCVFRFEAGLPYGRPLTVHRALARDLGAQVYFGMIGRRARYGEAVHPLAFEDGEAWCACDACLRSDATGVDGNLLFYRGHLVTTRWTALTVSELTRYGVDGAARPADGLLASTGLVAFDRSQWNLRPTANPFVDLSVDALTLRGVVANPVAPSNRSRRVLSLLNAVCAELEGAFDAAAVKVVGGAGGGALKGGPNGEVVPVVAFAGRPVDPPLVTFFAYLSYLAPPIRSRDVADPEETCHPYLMPYVAGTRDTIEYAQPGAEGVAPGTEAGALQRAARWPDQFNLERWTVAGAAQLGLYEYLLGGSLAVPRNYAARLTNALVWGRRFPIRGFVAEVQPAFALEGPMLWETARLLWDPSGGPATRNAPPPGSARVRRRYCERAFGAGSAAMEACLAVCEGAWSATRDRWELLFPGRAPVSAPDRRDNPTVVANYYGRGMAGRAGRLSQLDGWYEPSVRANGRDALTDAWALLGEALAATRSDPGASVRVQRLREGFGLTLLIALWYQPLHQAFLQIRRAANADLFQYVAELMSGTGSPGVVQYTLADETNPALRADEITKNRTDIVRTLSEAQVPPVTMPRSVEPGRTLVDRIRICIGTQRESGIRELRLRVHQYLARRDASLVPPHFTAEEAAPYQSVRLGFGLFEGASAAELRAGDGQWIPLAAPSGPARLAGLNLSAVMDYQTWWLKARTVQEGTSFVLRRDADTDDRVRNVDAAGLGWMFTGLKEMAAVVLLYGREIATDGRDLLDRKAVIMNG